MFVTFCIQTPSPSCLTVLYPHINSFFKVTAPSEMFTRLSHEAQRTHSDDDARTLERLNDTETKQHIRATRLPKSEGEAVEEGKQG